MGGTELSHYAFRRLLEAPEAVRRLVDVAEDAALVPSAPGVDQPGQRSLFPKPSEVDRVILEDG
eukprot:14724024-Alexandrium_andersonii.AAC.1